VLHASSHISSANSSGIGSATDAMDVRVAKLQTYQGCAFGNSVMFAGTGIAAQQYKDQQQARFLKPKYKPTKLHYQLSNCSSD
jgi:hypothetical protein